jgi:hypothetical protein
VRRSAATRSLIQFTHPPCPAQDMARDQDFAGVTADGLYGAEAASRNVPGSLRRHGRSVGIRLHIVEMVLLALNGQVPR